jgi:hypothetical protein
MVRLLFLAVALSSTAGSPAQSRISYSTDFDVTSYGADRTGAADSTVAIQSAIHAMQKACAAPTRTAGCTVVFPRGTFLFGPVTVQGVYNAGLRFSAGSHLRARRSTHGWPRQASILTGTPAAPANQRQQQRAPYVPWLGAEGCHNLTVEGEGVFDGGGDFWWGAVPNAEEDNPRPFMMQFTRITGLTVKGLTLTNTPHIHMSIDSSTDVDISGTVFNTTYAANNTEAIGLSGVSGAHVHGVLVHNGDDCVHATGTGTENIVVENSTFFGGHGLSICGGGAECTVSNVLFTNNTMIDTSIGARIKLTSKTKGFIRNVTWSHLRMFHVKHPLIIDVGYHSSADAGRHAKMYISGVHLVDIQAHDDMPQGFAEEAPGRDSSGLLRLGHGGGGKIAEAGSLLCSDNAPCRNVYMEDVQIHTDKKWICNSFLNLVAAERVTPQLTSCKTDSDEIQMAVQSSETAPPALRSAFTSWELVLLHGAVEAHGARCLDGSPAGFYIERGSDATRFVVHLQGGGWCINASDCRNRAGTHLGSSVNYSSIKDDVLSDGAHGLLSNSSEVNPVFANATKVWVMYCDGASFSGQRSEPVLDDHTRQQGAAPLHYRGKAILDAVLAELLGPQGMSGAEQLIVTGCSAGALAVYLHLDYIAQQAAAHGVKEVRGLPQSGFFMDLPNASGVQTWTPRFRDIALMQNVTGDGPSLNAGCVAAHSTETRWRCFMAQYSLPFVKTPLFAVQSVYDEWQGVNILGVDPNCLRAGKTACKPADVSALDDLRSAILGNISSANSTVDFFLYDCATHCGYLDKDNWNDLDDGRNGLRDSISLWMQGKTVRSAAAALPSWGPRAYATCTGTLLKADDSAADVL